MRGSEIEVEAIDKELAQIDQLLAEADLDDEGDQRYIEARERRERLERRREQLVPATVSWS